MSENLSQVTLEGKTEFLPFNVVEAAYARFERLYRTYDDVVIWFTGGKDSQVCLELARRTLDKMGQKDRKVVFAFTDLEFLEDECIAKVQEYYDDPGYLGVWLAAPVTETMVVLGERREVKCWDKARQDQWVRKPPEGAVLTIPEFGENAYGYTKRKTAVFNGCRVKGVTGTLSLVVSHRFTENPIIRMPLMTGEPDSCWIARGAEGIRGMDVSRPIYDWSVKDVFRYFYDEGINYALAYDVNMHNGGDLRAGTPPMDLVGSGKMDKLRTGYPTLYMQIITMWPEMATETRYAEDIDVMEIVNRYPRGWAGVLQYIEDTFTDPAAKAAAMKAVGAARKKRETNRLRGKLAPTYKMPLLWVWQHVISGNYAKGIDGNQKPTKAMIDFDIEVFGSNGR